MSRPMNKLRGISLALTVLGNAVALSPPADAQGASITAMTFFGTNDQGTVNDALRWNTAYLDPAWDIAIFAWKDPATVNWAADLLNNGADYGVNLALAPGDVKTFGFVVSGAATLPPEGYYGLNIFFDDREEPVPGTPGVSVFAYSDVDGPGGAPAYNAIPPSISTMGWPWHTPVGGSGSLVYVSVAQGVKVTLTDFVVYTPAALGLDLVIAQEPGGRRLTDTTDGTLDIVGSFTLAVEAAATPPSDLSCTRSQDGTTTDLAWTNHGAYDSLKVLRDGAEIANLATTATSYRDTSVPIGTVTYRVQADIDGVLAGPSCTVIDPAHGEAIITAMTFFETNAQGSLNPRGQWNTIYPDAAWDIAVFEGDAPPAVPVTWLNDLGDYSVDLRLFEGDEKTFGFAVAVAEAPVAPSWFGLNLFFGGAQNPSPGTPGISVFTLMDDTAFQVIGNTTTTTGWPYSPVAGSGSLTFIEPLQGVKVTLTDYFVYSPDSLGTDLVQKQEPGGRRLTEAPDGVNDLFGQFTIKVEPASKPPADLACTRTPDGATVNLSWVNDGLYTSLKILRDKKELADLAVSATSYQDTSVPAGTHTYQVLAEIKGIATGPTCTVSDPAHAEVTVTAMTFFQANDQGSVNPLGRWNTYYPDAAWDIAVFEGEAPPDQPVEWINETTDYAVNLRIVEGQEKTFGFVVSGVPPNYFGLNLFFDGAQNPTPGTPGISVFALTDDDGPDVGVPPPFSPIAATTNTMGWPIADVGGSGTLTYIDDAQGVKVTLTDLVLYSPSALSLDLVQAQEPGGKRLTEATDQAPDLIGQFTLSVEPVAKAPTDLDCTRSQDGKTVDMTWTNNGVYESLKVFRDGAQIASLPVSSTSYQDTNVPAFTRTYKLVYGSNGEQDGPSCVVTDPANPEVFLTALTLYGATEFGVVRAEERWNTLYLDPAWDVGLYEGELITDPDEYDPADPDFWLNDPTDMSIDLQLRPGQERTFSFHVGRTAEEANWFGMNFFFDGKQNPPGGTAGISVLSFTDTDGPEVGDKPAFAANPANPTMGWPIADIPGAGTLVYEDTEQEVRITLTDFVVFTQSAINDGAGIDLVQKQNLPDGSVDLLSIAAPDGVGDFTGQFTLKVESTGTQVVNFRRGDADAKGGVPNITDGIYVLNFLFLGGPEPPCYEAANADDKGGINITDGIFILNYLFQGGPAPPAPGPDACGPEPAGSQDDVGCITYEKC